MKSEMQFFMKKKNEEDFIAIFSEKCEQKIHNSIYYELWIGLNFIQFCPSKIYENQLTSGRIAYITIDFDDNRAESVYKEMGRFLRKNYKNKMRVVNVMNGAEGACSIYYSKEVANWILEKPENKLVQFKDGFVRFIPELS